MTAAVILFAAVCSLFLYLLTYVLRMTGLFFIISIRWYSWAAAGAETGFGGNQSSGGLSYRDMGFWERAVTDGIWEYGANGGSLADTGCFPGSDTGAGTGKRPQCGRLMDLSASLQEQIHQLVDLTAGKEEKGTVNRGNQRPTGQERLEVAVSEIPKETLYLKNFTGSRYMGDSWEEADEEKEKEPLAFTCLLDEKEPQLSLQTRDLTVPDSPWLTVDASFPGGEEGDGHYRQYAAEHYMEVPVSSLPQIMQLCGENPLTESESATDQRAAADPGENGLQPDAGQVPLGRDTIEYYLFEKGEGYCQHFACAAALMYRIYGIPSRYASAILPGHRNLRRMEKTFMRC